MLTSLELVAAAISMSPVSSSKAHQSSLPQREVDRFDLQEVVAGLELSCGEGHSGATANPMTGDLPDAVADVLQTGSDGVTASVHRLGRSGSCGMEGLYLRLQN